MIKVSDFPSDFYWGTGISAQQTEGNHFEDGKGKSIWDEFFANKSKWENWENSPHKASNFYLDFEKDIEILHQLGIKNFRFSISWTRILPDGTGVVNATGISYYNKLIDCLLEKGIEPWITLYHWDLPQKLQEKGGWTNRDIVEQFKNYVSLCIGAFGDRVKNWMILNEPSVFAGAGHFLGIHPPGMRGLDSFLKASHHACLCVAEGAKLVKNSLPTSNVGSTYSFTHFEAKSNKQIHIKAQDRVHGVINRFFLEPNLGMGYPIMDYPFLKSIEKYFKDGDDQLLFAPLDFIGVQTYTREIVKFSPFTPYLWAKRVNPTKRKVELTAMGWENYPDALAHILDWLAGYEQIKSLIITESGIALEDKLLGNIVADPDRIHFFNRTVEHLYNSRKKGIPINGFFTWSFMDNLEWAEGYSPRFGMVYVNFKTQERHLKHSAIHYKHFLSRH